MVPTVRWTEPPSPCLYLPDHVSQFEYLSVSTIEAFEYLELLRAGWRRFGRTLFRQSCSGPGACRALRVDALRFRPDRSQRRAQSANQGTVRLSIGAPGISRERVSLFERFHAERSQTRGWSPYESDDVAELAASFLDNPLPTQEWCYHLGEKLVGIGYVDVMAGGLSGIYFVRDPAYHDRSLGTWNVLCLLDRARALGVPHVYLGYHTAGCPSLQYKGRFRPNQTLDPDGTWRDHAT